MCSFKRFFNFVLRYFSLCFDLGFPDNSTVTSSTLAMLLIFLLMSFWHALHVNPVNFSVVTFVFIFFV